jgi:tetratricopeptide (TPR) repeat protein
MIKIFKTLCTQEDNLDAWLHRANALIGLGRFEEAKEDVSKLIEVYHHDPKVTPTTICSECLGYFFLHLFLSSLA